MSSYILKKEKAKSKETCSWCKQLITDGNQILVETRDTWFRGEDELDWYHGRCKSQLDIWWQKEQSKEQKRTEARYKRFIESTKPKWDKLDHLIKENNIEVKKYPETGQWVLNGKVDWWTTTGTAINRKTKERYNFSINNPEFIISKVLN